MGVAAILLIMPKVLIHCQIRNSFTSETIKSILRGITSIDIPTQVGMEPIDF